MKKMFVILGCVAALQAMTSQSSFAHYRYGSFGVSFSIFYDGLSPYGEWIAVGGGVYGWRPVGVAVGWRPYTVGRWVWTDDGWYWVSDEPWGWAAYHYGRWHHHDYYGWTWIPGYDWAPAWVEWRYGGDYIGWAPLSPYAVFSMSWGIHYRTRWYTPVYWWNFVGCRYIASPNVHRYVYRSENNTRYIGVTRSGGSVRYEGGRIMTRGPEREYVERRGNVRAEPVKIREVEDRQVERIVRDGNREQIEVYRPRIQERNADDENVGRPSRVREDAGRTLDLDTRKIDVRAREIEREEGRDVKRAEEFRTRDAVGRSEERKRDLEPQRDDGMLKGPVDDAIRNREGRTRERVEQQEPKRDEGRTYNRPRSKEERGRGQEQQPGVRPDGPVRRSGVNEGGRPERQPQPRPEPRERKREESVERPQREEFRSPNPERTTRRPEFNAPQQPRMEMPARRNDSYGGGQRSEAPRNSGGGGGGRSEGGRSGRGR